jgi:hypothetical protein
MKTTERSIPSDFQKLDTNINAANSFCNVRDLQTLRENHRFLCASWSKRLIFSCARGADDPITVRARNADGARANRGIVWSGLIQTTPYTQSVRLYAYICLSSLNGATGYNPAVDGYPALTLRLSRPLSSMGSDDEVITSGNITSPNGTPVALTLQAGVPSTAGSDNYGGGYCYWFCEIGVNCKIDNDTDEDSAFDIYQVGTRELEVLASDITNTAVGNVLYFSRSDIEPRTIVKITTETRHGSDYKRLHLDESIAEMPIPGTDTGSSTQMLGADIYSLGLYEEAPTDFESKTGYV